MPIKQAADQQTPADYQTPVGGRPVSSTFQQAVN